MPAGQCQEKVIAKGALFPQFLAPSNHFQPPKRACAISSRPAAAPPGSSSKALGNSLPPWLVIALNQTGLAASPARWLPCSASAATRRPSASPPSASLLLSLAPADLWQSARSQIASYEHRTSELQLALATEKEALEAVLREVKQLEDGERSHASED